MANKARDSFVSYWGTVVNTTSVWYPQNKPKMVIYVQAEMFSNWFKLRALKSHRGTKQTKCFEHRLWGCARFMHSPTLLHSKVSFRSTGATSGSNIPNVWVHTRRLSTLQLSEPEISECVSKQRRRGVFLSRSLGSYSVCVCGCSSLSQAFCYANCGCVLVWRERGQKRLLEFSTYCVLK